MKLVFFFVSFWSTQFSEKISNGSLSTGYYENCWKICHEISLLLIMSGRHFSFLSGHHIHIYSHCYCTFLCSISSYHLRLLHRHHYLQTCQWFDLFIWYLLQSLKFLYIPLHSSTELASRRRVGVKQFFNYYIHPPRFISTAKRVNADVIALELQCNWFLMSQISHSITSADQPTSFFSRDVTIFLVFMFSVAVTFFAFFSSNVNFFQIKI